MAQLTAQRIKDALTKFFSALDTTDDAMVNKMLTRKYVQCRLFDAATAGTAMTVTTFWENNTGVTYKVVDVKVVAPVAVAADNTDYVTFTLSKYTGASATAVASSDTRAANMNALAAFIPESLTITAAAAEVPDGYTLAAAVAKAGSGKAITAATSDAYLLVTLEPV